MSSSIEPSPAAKSRLHAPKESGISSTGGFVNRSRSDAFVLLAAGCDLVAHGLREQKTGLGADHQRGEMPLRASESALTQAA
jgi:hypothetical protein